MPEKKERYVSSNLNDSLAFNISRVGLLLRRELVQVLREYKMTPEQWQIMMTLGERDKGVPQKDIAAAIFKDKHALSRMVMKLEHNGWVTKLPAAQDRRITLVTITQQGRQALAEMKMKLTKHMQHKVFHHFDDNKKAQLKQTMKTMRTLLGDVFTAEGVNNV